MAGRDNGSRLTDVEAEGLPETDEQPPGVDDDIAVESVAVPRDHPQAAAGYGTTVAEQQGDEPLALRVRREEPEVEPGSPARPRRLVQPDQGVVGAADEPAEVAEEAVEDARGLSAEEAAEHLEEP